MPKYVETTTQLHSSHTLQSNAQNSPSEASMVHELRTSRCTSWIRKDRGTRDQIANIHWIIEKVRQFQRNIYFWFIDYTKSFDCMDHSKLWKILKRWEYQTTLPAFWEMCIQVKKQQNWTWKTQQWPQDWKRSVFISSPKKGHAKKCSNYHTVSLISHTSKVMLEILQARLQQYVNCELPDVQARFRKGRGTRDQITNIHWIIEKAREFQQNI